MTPTDEQIDQMMRESGLEAIAAKDYREGRKRPMTTPERDQYDAALYFARLVLERYGAEGEAT